MSQKIDNGDVRVHFDFSPALLKSVDDMCYKCELATKKSLINEALSLLKWAIETVEQGDEVARVSKDRKSFEILRTPALHAAKRTVGS